ncbi:hypothetical protein C8Q78DRAFT_1074407 [Trametes maxima]|nr:hypothetical protein C8Q78DRAFT_1074407 [Trametes maxima]
MVEVIANVGWVDNLMGNNGSRPSANLHSRPQYSQDRSFSKGGWSTRRRRGYDDDPYNDDAGDGYAAHQPYAPPFPAMPQQPFYSQGSQFTAGQPLVFPQPQMQAGVPVIPPMTGAVPTTGNPFPAPPVNMGAPDPVGGMGGMPEPVIPGPGQNPEAPVIPPMPAHMRRAGTPYHRPTPYPGDSPSSDEYEDDLTPQTRERLQPPLAPGQYGPFDRSRDRRGPPAPALRRDGHRRAGSSPAFGRDHSPFGHGPEPPVIPGEMGGMYGQAPFLPQHQHQHQQHQHQHHPHGGMFQQQEPLRREPSPIRPRPWSPIRLTHNPLPPPPRDIFQNSPYSRLLRELRKPIDEEGIKARLGAVPAIQTVNAIPVTTAVPGHHQGSRSSREKKRKGLFRSLSSRLNPRRDEDEYGDMSPPGPATTTFVGGQSTAIYPVIQSMPDGTTTLTYNPPPVALAQPQPAPGGVSMPMPMPTAAAAPVVAPPVMPGYVPSAAPAVSPGVVPAASQQMPFAGGARAPSPSPSPSPAVRMPTPQPQPPQPPPPPPPPPIVRFERSGALGGLAHTSLHRVHYNHKSYPTVLHLIEALRFLPGQPDIAESVRRCGTAEEAAVMAENWRHLWRQDLEGAFGSIVDEALYTKFMQHPRLRELLLGTGDADLVFSDGDTTWGDGLTGRGYNHLGRALQRVRDRLHAEGVDS